MQPRDYYEAKMIELNYVERKLGIARDLRWPPNKQRAS